MERGKFNKTRVNVSVIIPSFNNKEYLAQAVDSVLKNNYPQIELIIVDNNSDTETKNYLKEIQIKKNVKVIFNEENKGFPKAVNQGILESKGKYVLIANNDVIVPPNSIKRMVEIAESNHEIGIVGAISNYVSGPQFDENAKYSSPKEMFDYAEQIAKEHSGELLEFPRVAFLFTLIKKSVIEKIGGLDERFSPGNFEDDDFCLRAQLEGYKTVIAKDVFIHHYGSKSFKQSNEEYDKIIQTNLKKFVAKWGATPEEIWLEGKEFKRRNIFYPLSGSPFETHFERTLILTDEKDYSMAIEELELAIESFDSYQGNKFANISKAELLHLAGTLYLNLNNYEKAVEFFENELEETPDSVKPLEAIAETFLTAGLTDAALEIAKTIKEVDPLNKFAENLLNKKTG